MPSQTERLCLNGKIEEKITKTKIGDALGKKILASGSIRSNMARHLFIDVMVVNFNMLSAT